MTAQEHKYYKQAYSAHLGTSFSPEKRAASECSWYDEECANLKAIGKEAAIEKFTTLFLKWMSAKSRVVSTMIAGPAKFPVARMEKYNNWEQSAGQNCLDFLTKVKAPPKQPRTELDYSIEAKEYKVGEVTVIQNVDENRLQLIFPDKPELDMITKLKSRGFKWSPRFKAWQRQLTPNALRVVPYLFNESA
jgi:hypothetical protein